MIKINQIKMPIEYTPLDLENKVRKLLRLKDKGSLNLTILKKSIDSRKKPNLFYVLSVSVSLPGEEAIVKRANSKDITLYQPKTYEISTICSDIDHHRQTLKDSPLIVGAGPAGLFAALILTEAGYHPILIEQGKTVENRKKDVEAFWETGILNPDSNAIFGEGGAGTFSDGKLNTAIKDPTGRIHYVLSKFHEFGAPESILYENKPHIGTDVLVKVLQNLRNYLSDHGCSFLFEHRLTGLVSDSGHTLSAVKVLDLKNKSQKVIPAEALILAPGHGARNTFELIEKNKILMEPKLFAVGFRVEHPQKMINQFAYGSSNLAQRLPASPYKVTSNFPGGRGVYSFCMCPGGYVVNSSSEEGATVVNGMSYSGRDGQNANSAIIVSLSPKDFVGDSPLAGIDFQKELERKTFERGGGKIPQQLFGDFKANRLSDSYGDYDSTTKGSSCFSQLNEILPYEMEASFVQGMEHFAKIIPNFDRADAILSGTESRTSSPVRILRNEELESSMKGLYPCGEGAGYAGGITSAAVDGIKVAEAVIRAFAPEL